MASGNGSQMMETDKSIDAWTERLASLGICVMWLFIAVTVYGLACLVAMVFS